MPYDLVSFPLRWPQGVARTLRPMVSRFHTSLQVSLRSAIHEIEMMGGKSIEATTNLPVRRGVIQDHNEHKVPDRGVAIYFDFVGKRECIACDKWASVSDNLRAIGKTVESIRGIERWGVSGRVDAALQGFLALPDQTGHPWWEVIGVDPSTSFAQVRDAYLTKARSVHPDVGGSHEEFVKLEEAMRSYLSMNPSRV